MAKDYPTREKARSLEEHARQPGRHVQQGHVVGQLGAERYICQCD